MDRVYGMRAWREWLKHAPSNLAGHMTPRWQVGREDERGRVESYVDLQEIVSFLNVMNKGEILLFRGQPDDYELLPTLYRKIWHPPVAVGLEAVDLTSDRQHFVRQLERARKLVRLLLQGRLPRWRPFDIVPTAAWAVIQHYNIWPTPALDLTSSLRVAASFALGLKQARGASRRASALDRKPGYLYVFGFDQIISDVMRLDAAPDDETERAALELNVVRLSALCPPTTVRPHLQEAFLVTFPLPADELRPAATANARLIAVIELVEPRTEAFWTTDFPQHSEALRDDELAAEIARRITYRFEEERLSLGELVP